MKHSFAVDLHWAAPSATTTTADSGKTYIKSHRLHMEGKAALYVSAAKAFKGDPTLYNPEDLLLSSLISCHMMSYLYICGQQGVELLAYSDQAEGTLETSADGSGRFVEVCLHPEVTLADENQASLAQTLHQEAHKLCFIANSCNFPIHIKPSFTTL